MIAAGITVFGALSVYSSTFATALANAAASRVIDSDRYVLSFGRVQSLWTRTIRAEGVVLSEPGGGALVRIDSLVTRGHWVPLLRGDLVLDGATLAGVSLALHQRPDGAWVVPRGDAPEGEGGARWFVGDGGLTVRSITVALEAAPGTMPERAKLLQARAHVSDASVGDSVLVVMDSIRVRYRPAGAGAADEVSLDRPGGVERPACRGAGTRTALPQESRQRSRHRHRFGRSAIPRTRRLRDSGRLAGAGGRPVTPTLTTG